MSGVPPPDGSRAVGFGAFARRWAGMSLWAAVDPHSLPARWARPARPWTGRGFALWGAGVCSALVLAVAAVTVAASIRLADLAAAFAVIPEEASLEESAWRIERGVSDAWWAPLAPVLRGRLESLAERIRSGRAELAALAREYEAARRAIAAAEPGERNAVAVRRLGALDERLAAIGSVWLRQTLSYESLEGAITPVLEAARAGARVPTPPPPLGPAVERELGS